MKREIIVIADDITGAAEIAGLGFVHGLTTSLLTELPESLPECQLVVLATDTRSMDEAGAVVETQRVARRIRTWMGEGCLLFKKVDSAVRGHVVAELLALLSLSPYEEALYMPANPSRGRTLRHSCYYLDGKPLSETPFASDPEFPCLTSHVLQRLGLMPEGPIRVPSDVQTRAEVDALVQEALADSRPTLLAGAADLFVSLLSNLGWGEEVSQSASASLSSVGKCLVVCGSTQSTDLSTTPFVRCQQLQISPMPSALFRGEEPPSVWSGQLLAEADDASSGGWVLTIPYANGGQPGVALRLRQTMAEVVGELVAQASPSELVIEGGSTAFAIVHRLGWSRFELVAQIAPGVVRMRSLDAPSTCLTFKPGSYPWGETFKVKSE